MIQNTLSHEADQASARYALLTDGWQGLFETALNQEDFGSPNAMRKVIEAATISGQAFIDQEFYIANSVADDIAVEAHQTTLREIASNDTEKLTESVTDHLSAAVGYLTEEIVAQVHRDISNMRQTMRNVAFEVSIASRSRGISQRKAMIEYRLGSSTKMDFAFMDRGNRKWSSRKFIRTLWRHTLLSVYNETVMMGLADHGIREAKVSHVDPNAESHGMVIAFGSNSSLPNYSEIRDTIFHPNSNAVLAMEKSVVST